MWADVALFFGPIYVSYTPNWVIIHSGKDRTFTAINFITVNTSKECLVVK